MSRIVVFGATGFAGSRIVDEAARRGHSVIAASRRTPVSPGSPDGLVRPVSASLYDRDAVLDLARDAEVVVCAINSGPDPDRHSLIDAVPILADAARDIGSRIGVVGGAGSLLLTERGPAVVSKLETAVPPEKLRDIRIHIDVLDALRRTPVDVDWFYLSPPVGFGAHVPGRRTGHYRLGGEVMLAAEDGSSSISGEDYALAFIDEIDRPRHHRCRFTVGY